MAVTGYYLVVLKAYCKKVIPTNGYTELESVLIEVYVRSANMYIPEKTETIHSCYTAKT